MVKRLSLKPNSSVPFQKQISLAAERTFSMGWRKEGETDGIEKSLKRIFSSYFSMLKRLFSEVTKFLSC